MVPWSGEQYLNLRACGLLQAAKLNDISVKCTKKVRFLVSLTLYVCIQFALFQSSTVHIVVPIGGFHLFQEV